MTTEKPCTDAEHEEPRPQQAECYDVRCFRRAVSGSLRRGVWVMTGEARGLFVHGDRNEIQAPKWDIADLAGDILIAEEITPAQVLAEIANWPEAVAEVQRCFDRHRRSS